MWCHQWRHSGLWPPFSSLFTAAEASRDEDRSRDQIRRSTPNTEKSNTGNIWFMLVDRFFSSKLLQLLKNQLAPWQKCICRISFWAFRALCPTRHGGDGDDGSLKYCWTGRQQLHQVWGLVDTAGKWRTIIKLVSLWTETSQRKQSVKFTSTPKIKRCISGHLT